MTSTEIMHMRKTKEQCVIYPFHTLPTTVGEYNKLNKTEDCNYSNKTSSRRCILRKKRKLLH